MLPTLISFVITIFIFGLLIFVHELGHYLVARAFGVGVIEFAIGMGPRIKSWKGKYNTFSIRAIPIGGFINMVGEYDDEIPEEHKFKIPLNTKPVWQRMLITIAGPLMNIALAFLVMAVIVSCTSMIGSTIVHSFEENSAFESAGLMPSDEIVRVDGKNVRCYQDLSYKIMSSAGEEIDVTVLRNGERITFENIRLNTIIENGIEYGEMDFYVQAAEKTLGRVLYEAFWQSVSTVYMTVDSLIDTFSGKYGMDAVGGPIAIGGEINDTIQQSVGFAETAMNLGMLTVLISVSLGICNLLPIPVLDGGRLLFYLIELVTKKPVNKKFEQTVSSVFTALLMLLMIFVALKDIVGLF